MTNPLTCSENFCDTVQEWLIARIDGEMTCGEDIAAFADPARVQSMEAHLADCAACREYRQTMGHLVDALRDIPEVPLPMDLTDRILSQINQELAMPSESVDESGATVVPITATGSRSAKPSNLRWMPLTGTVGTVAAVVMVLMLAWSPLSVMSPLNSPEQAAELAQQQFLSVEDHPTQELAQVTTGMNVTVTPEEEVKNYDPIDDIVGF